MTLKAAAYRFSFRCRSCHHEYAKVDNSEASCPICAADQPYVRGITTLYELANEEEE